MTSVLCSALVVLGAAAPLKLAAPGLRAVGIEEKKVAVFTDYLAQQLSLYGIRVTTEAEVQAMLGLERQKQLLGCSDEGSSCMAELAGALGVDGLITGNFAKLDKGYILTLKIVSPNGGAPLGSYSGRVADDDAALEWLSGAAREFAAAHGLATAAPPPTASRGVHLRGKSWIPAAAAAVLLGVGLYLVIDTLSFASTLRTGGGVPPDQLTTSIAGAQTRQITGDVLIGVGVAALGTAAIFFFTGSEPAAAVSAVPVPGGSLVAFTWRLP
jgi:hypothetical protein